MILLVSCQLILGRDKKGKKDLTIIDTELMCEGRRAENFTAEIFELIFKLNIFCKKFCVGWHFGRLSTSGAI